MVQFGVRRLGNECLFLSSSPSVGKLKHPSVLLSRVSESVQFARLCEIILMIDKFCGNILKEVSYAFTDCGGCNMAVSYNRLWKLLIDRKMSKADLRKQAEIAPNTMTKLRRDEEVTLGVLGKICKTLDVDYADIMEYVRD